MIYQLADDIRAYARFSADFQAKRAGVLRTISILLTPSLMCCLAYRISHALWRRRLHLLARTIARLNLVVHKATITPGSEIGAGLYIPHTVGVYFNGRAGENLVLYARATVGPADPRAVVSGSAAAGPTLGSNVIVGAIAAVVGPITVGDNVNIGAAAVLTRDVPSGSNVMRKGGARAG